MPLRQVHFHIVNSLPCAYKNTELKLIIQHVYMYIRMNMNQLLVITLPLLFGFVYLFFFLQR